MQSFPLTALSTLLIVVLLVWIAVNVGIARHRYGVRAPAINGHEMFERAYRVQMNTLEILVAFLPCLWISRAM
jgi:glutathione S-transferase